MSPSQQILRNLYVEYFKSREPCSTPDGSLIHPYQSTSGEIDPRRTICLRMPYICQMAQPPRTGRKFSDGAAGMLSTFYKMITGGLDNYVPLTSQSSSMVSSRLASLWDSAAAHHLTAQAQARDCRSPHGRILSGCPETRNMCKTEQNVVFPIVGRSAFGNTSVTIVQDYPAFIQPIFYRKCRSVRPQLVYGKCVQEFLPVGVFVQPSAPGSVLAQNFVLVESGCRAVIDLSAPQWKSAVRSSSSISPDVETTGHASAGNFRLSYPHFSRG
ncbi:uncharacterized protein LOC143034964 [Oratosquilla oratoria]|uniref:uncharacterized protein LOC143034964 n=1 Tax=Oratosquilla oratoria TaxID=337810 RepID=UPI003F76390E